MRCSLFLLILYGIGLQVAAVDSPIEHKHHRPYVRGTITQKGVDELCDLLIPVVNKEFRTLKLHDIEIKEKGPKHVGDVKLKFKGIELTNLRVKDLKAQLKKTNAIEMHTKDALFDLKTDFEWKKEKDSVAREHERIHAKPKKSTMMVHSKISVKKSRPHVRVTKKETKIHGFDISHHEHWEKWLDKLVKKAFHTKIRKAVERKIDYWMMKMVNKKANKFFCKMPSEVEFGRDKYKGRLNLALHDLIIKDEYATVGTSLHLTNARTGKACPLKPVTLPHKNPSENMFQLMVSDAWFNCFGWMLYENDAIQIKLDGTQHPEYPLNTKKWKDVLPQLYEQYPDETMVINITATKAPTIESSHQGFILTLDLNANSSVFDDGSVKYTHTIGVHINVGLLFTAHDKDDTAYLFFNITQATVQLSVVDSSIGEITIDKLQEVVNNALPEIREKINRKFRKGARVPPVGRYNLRHPHIIYSDDYASVSTDIMRRRGTLQSHSFELKSFQDYLLDFNQFQHVISLVFPPPEQLVHKILTPFLLRGVPMVA